MNSYTKPDMPDVAATQPAQQNGTLDWVGMSRIALPLTIQDQDLGEYTANTFVETYVNLVNPQVKGIHMSRLYLLLAEFAREDILTITNLVSFLKDKLASHEDISDTTCLQVDFDYFINQPALKSEYSGWKDYPVRLKAVYDSKQTAVELSVKIPYSSTCPCSAALSRQLLQQAFQDDFDGQDSIDKVTIEKWLRSDRGSVATPHSQRSYANIQVKLDGTYTQGFPISELIQLAESTLKTAVQTAVKREDEQEFARLNGANQMFCEDAARRLKMALNGHLNYQDFWVRVEHIESLHAHDAVAMATKGIEGGYQPLLHR
ncbi:MAG: GTP cyclohydrolase FolE2 [Pseudomonadota bacterium]